MNAKLVLITVAIVFCGGSVQEKKTPAEDTGLQGTWSTVDQNIAIPPILTYKIVVTTDRITWYALWDGKTSETETPYKLVLTTKPKSIDFTRKGDAKPYVGIYEVKGDKLRLCYRGPGNERPTEFERTGRPPGMLFEFERVRSPDKGK